jgi:hypothetical protein
LKRNGQFTPLRASGSIEGPTFKGPNQRLRIKRCGCRPRAAIDGNSAVCQAVYKVADDKVLVGEVVQGEAGALWKEALGPCTVPLHGRRAGLQKVSQQATCV